MPIKNEAWILPTTLSSIRPFVDEIIIIDDHSVDDSVKIALSFGAKVYQNDLETLAYFDEYKVRERLLALGRAGEGTHFIFLDADECFSSNFLPSFKKSLEQLKPGQKLSLRWIPLWKSVKEYRDEKSGAFQVTYKDIAFCDDQLSRHVYAYIGVSRTPGENKPENIVQINQETGVVLHFQFVAWERNEMKQAWYKCSELINTKRSARRINVTYQHLIDNSHINVKEVPLQWTKNLEGLNELQIKSTLWYKETIFSLFKQYGIVFFEPLEIWHIAIFKEQFVKEVGRLPHPKRFPSFIIKLNKLRRKLL